MDGTTRAVWGRARTCSSRASSRRSRSCGVASDDALVPERVDLRRGVSDLTEDRVRVLAERRRAVPEAARRLREIDGRRRERDATRDAWILGVDQQPGATDVSVVERLLRRVERARRNLRALQLFQRLLGRALSRPLAHSLADVFGVVATRLVVLEAWIREPAVLAHQLRPAREHRVPDGVRDDPAVLRAKQIRWRRRLPAVLGGDAIDLDRLLLDERGVVERDRRAQQRPFHLLP